MVLNTKTHGFYLCIDTATPIVQIGIWKVDTWICLYTSPEETLQSLFELTQQCLATAGLGHVHELKGIYFCQGPGSVLSLRITIMALRTWMQLDAISVYSYTSLDFGYACALKLGARYPFYIVAPGRHGSWYAFEAKNPENRIYHHLKTLELPGNCYLIPQRKYTLTVPENSVMLSYSLTDAPEFFVNRSCFKQVTVPEIFQLTEPSMSISTNVL